MFEQASIDTRGMLRSPWAITASVAGQTIVVGAVGLISLLQTDALPKALFMPGPLAAPGNHIKVVDPPAGSVVPRRSPSSLRVFVAPAKISALQDNNSHDAAVLALIDDPLAIGVGIPGPGGGS